MFIPLWALFIVVPILISILGSKDSHCSNCCPELDDSPWGPREDD